MSSETRQIANPFCVGIAIAIARPRDTQEAGSVAILFEVGSFTVPGTVGIAGRLESGRKVRHGNFEPAMPRIGMKVVRLHALVYRHPLEKQTKNGNSESYSRPVGGL